MKIQFTIFRKWILKSSYIGNSSPHSTQYQDQSAQSMSLSKNMN